MELHQGLCFSMYHCIPDRGLVHPPVCSLVVALIHPSVCMSIMPEYISNDVLVMGVEVVSAILLKEDCRN